MEVVVVMSVDAFGLCVRGLACLSDGGVEREEEEEGALSLSGQKFDDQQCYLSTCIYNPKMSGAPPSVCCPTTTPKP